jgi:hypothetical protein
MLGALATVAHGKSRLGMIHVNTRPVVQSFRSSFTLDSERTSRAHRSDVLHLDAKETTC